MTRDPSPPTPAQEHGLETRGVSLTYPNGPRALNNVSVSIKSGEFVAVLGPNGSGKSSLLRTLAGILPPDTGTVWLNGKELRAHTALERARQIAWVPQSLPVVSHFSVEEFVLLGRYAHLTGWRLFGKRDHELVHENLARVDALDFRCRAMDEMSGGERQRVLLARALAQESRIILLDEPTSALDLKHQLMVYRLIHKMNRAEGRTVIVVTHDLNLASQFSDRVILMQQGEVAAQGTPDEALRPENLQRVYDAELAFGRFEQSVAGGPRPWILPWAKP